MRNLRRLLLYIASLKFTIVILALGFVLVLSATVLQASMGVYEVQQKIFYSWFGGKLLVCLFSANMLASLIFRLPDIPLPLGLIVGHLGLVLLLFGGFTDIFSSYYILGIWEGEQADRIFYSDRWEILIAGDGEEVVVPLHKNARGEYTREIVFKGEQIRLNVKIDRFDFNAEPLQDPETGAGFLPIPWADDAASNLPLVRGSLDVYGISGGPIAIWAGNASPTNFPLPVNGELSHLAISLQPSSEKLPFSLRLDNFESRFYGNTEIPQAFQSDITIVDGGEIPGVISMNQPLRYRGYVFYQSSYQDDDRGGEASIFSVQKTRGASLPYIAPALSLLGFMLHYSTRPARKRFSGPGKPGAKTRRSVSPSGAGGLLLLLFFVVVFLGAAATPLSADDQVVPGDPAGSEALFTLAIQSSGRVMPIESFGEALLYELSGRRSTAGLDGKAFLSAALFDFPSLLHKEIIRVDNPAVFTALGLPEAGAGRYAPRVFIPALDVLSNLNRQLGEEDGLSRDIHFLYDRLQTLFALASSFEFAFSRSGQPAGDVELYQNHPLRIIPGEDGTWLHPAVAPAENIARWQRIFSAAMSLNESGTVEISQAAFSEAVQQVVALQHRHIDRRILALELLYRNTRPFVIAAWVFLLSAGCGIAATRIEKRPRLGAAASITAAGMGITAMAVTATGLVLRIVITQRPPVTNLYTTLLFAAFFLPLLSEFLLRNSRDQLWMVRITSAALLFISPGFIPGSDDLAVVQAVLDSNFWLSVHVLIIICGYAAVLYTAVLGHVQTISLLNRSAMSPSTGRRYRNLLTGQRLALLLMFLGTMLGGFWADQSWGRFWGWDPKENAALLLIIWLSIILHGRPAGLLNDFSFALASAASLLVLVFSWFGVNLMSAGLHSYGWDSRTGILVLVVSSGELIFIASALLVKLWQENGESAVGNSRMRYRISSVNRLNSNFIIVEFNERVKFRAGQSITLLIQHNGMLVRRAYSLLSGSPATIVIQRRDGGLAWEYFAADARMGQSMYGTLPFGNFVRSPEAGTELYFSSGVAAAPIIAMMQEAIKARGTADRLVLHAVTGSAEHYPFYNMLADLAINNGVLIYVYSTDGFPMEVTNQFKKSQYRESWGSLVFHHGRLEINDILSKERETAGQRAALEQLYLCGSDKFIASLTNSEGFRDSVNNKSIVKTESFSPAASRSNRPERASTVLVKPKNIVLNGEPGQSLMEILQQGGVALGGNCLVGQCGECRCNLLSGEIYMDEPNLLGKSKVTGGEVLSCCAYANGDVSIEL